jgi:ketosteroid isomerase-like protein
VTSTDLPTGAAAGVVHPNERLLRDFFDAFAAADPVRLAELTTPDLVWHFPGTSPISGDWHGVPGLLDGIRAIAMSLGQGKNGFELLHVLVGDDIAVTVHRDYYTGDDNSLDLRYVLFVRIADGRMAEVWEIPFDQAENDRYMATQAATLARAAGLTVAR